MLVLTASGAAYVVFRSSLFQVRFFKDNLNGNSKFLASLLAADKTLEKKWLGVFGYDNTFFWNLGAKTLTNPANLPSIERAEIKSSLFNDVVEFKVEKRQLAGVFCRQDCYLFDRAGIIFAPAPEVEGGLIVKITDSENRPVVLGQPFLRRSYLDNIFQTVDALHQAGFYFSDIKLSSPALKEWTAVFPAGRAEFRFSLTFAPKNLPSVLKELKKKIDFSKLSYIDFRVANRIYYQ